MAFCFLLQNRPSCPNLKSAVLSHFKIGDFVSFSKSAVLSHFRNRRFCLIFEIGGFVSFKIGCFVLPPLQPWSIPLLFISIFREALSCEVLGVKVSSRELDVENFSLDIQDVSDRISSLFNSVRLADRTQACFDLLFYLFLCWRREQKLSFRFFL